MNNQLEHSLNRITQLRNTYIENAGQLCWAIHPQHIDRMSERQLEEEIAKQRQYLLEQQIKNEPVVTSGDTPSSNEITQLRRQIEELQQQVRHLAKHVITLDAEIQPLRLYARSY